MEIVYQPIVDMKTEEPLGYEALSRFDDGLAPDEAFEQAWREGKGVELETKAARLALQNFEPPNDESYLAINLSADTIIATKDKPIKTTELSIPWSRIVLEITEHDEVYDYLPLYKPLAFFRENQTRVAVDDVGKGISGLWHIIQIMPHILKVDRDLIEDINKSPMPRAVVRAVVTMANEMRSLVVAEGIENEAEKEWCKELGVHCGQGYLFGRPGPLPSKSTEQS